MYRGERLPSASEQWTLARSIRRTQLKDRNALNRQMWEYESEDDIGEDLGEGGDMNDLDEAAAGELGEGGEEKKEGGDAKAKAGGDKDKDDDKDEKPKKK